MHTGGSAGLFKSPMALALALISFSAVRVLSEPFPGSQKLAEVFAYFLRYMLHSAGNWPLNSPLKAICTGRSAAGARQAKHGGS